MKRIRSKAGMSVVLAMIGLSIVSIILLAVFRLLDMSRDMAASFQTVIKAMDATQEVRFALADVATCTYNLQGLIPGDADKPLILTKALNFPPTQQIYNAYKRSPGKGSAVAAATGAADSLAQDIITFGGLGGTSLKVSKITLSLPDVPTPNTAILRIELMAKGTSVQRLRPRSLPVWIKQNAAGGITCCTTRNISLCP